MALLAHELEKVVILEVLPIGSGGDYAVLAQKRERPIQAEISGIREDRGGSESRSRLQTKCEQVLQHSKAGYASVTTFSHTATCEIHSYLHFVRRPKNPPKKRSCKR
jgi:hypothetical protein